MSAGDVLRESENSALNNGEFTSSVSGRQPKTKTGKLKSFTAAGFITTMILIFVVLFSSGNLIPSAISERLIEETDVQYADAVESKKIVFQQALYEGEIPDDTTQILKSNGVLVGYMKDDEFVETNKHEGGLSLKVGDDVVSAQNFITAVSSNVSLYNAFNNATYGRAAYYYDESAEEVFKRIGTSRNNYTDSEKEFDEVMDSLIGKGSEIDTNSVSLVEKVRKNEETGEEEVYYDYEENGGIAKSEDGNGFISAAREKNKAATKDEAALNAADTLKVADTISKEQRSSLFYLVFMENISKMKAGSGGESEINAAMNYLYEDAESSVVDTKTGELVTSKGTPLESPSLYAILSGNKVQSGEVDNYSSDRILKTVENQINNKNGAVAINGTVASSDTKVRGSIGRFVNTGGEIAADGILETVNYTISSSLVDNSYETIKGINAGEFLVEGAINVGKELAKKSGATAGDETAVVSYIHLNSEVLAMDARAERLNKSPFDITSKNTFLGSIIYDFSIGLRTSDNSFLSNITSIMATTGQAMKSLMPTSFADETEGYLTTFGDCETYGTIGAVGSAGCSEIATFDTSTLNDPFNDSGFKQFIEKNTTLSSSGSRTINEGSDLAEFILYNDERITPIGVIDGGILDSLNKNSSSVSFLTNILEMIKTFLGTSEREKRIANGASFVNSRNNGDWETYKYAQRYVSLARATSALKQYTNDKTAYSKIPYFEGTENPVVAFLTSYYAVNSR